MDGISVYERLESLLHKNAELEARNERLCALTSATDKLYDKCRQQVVDLLAENDRLTALLAVAEQREKESLHYKRLAVKTFGSLQAAKEAERGE